MYFSESPTDPPGGGGLDLGLFGKSNRPSGGGRLDLGLLKRANPGTRWGVLQSDPRINEKPYSQLGVAPSSPSSLCAVASVSLVRPLLRTPQSPLTSEPQPPSYWSHLILQEPGRGELGGGTQGPNKPVFTDYRGGVGERQATSYCESCGHSNGTLSVRSPFIIEGTKGTRSAAAT